MAQKNRTDLTTQANTIKNETANAANTATRVGTMHVDDIDSEVNWLSDVETDLTSNSDDKVPTVKAVVDGIAAIANELTANELAAINGANSPDATNVFLTEDDEVYVKDANDNVFYKGVTAALGTGCLQNTFHQGSASIAFGDDCTNNIVEQECNAITLGNSCGVNRIAIGCGNLVLGNGCTQNTFEQGSVDITIGTGCINNIFELNAQNIIFGDALQRTTVKTGNYAALDLTASPTFDFLYSLAYPSEIYLDLNGDPYHQYYDGANNRFVITLLISPYTVSYIGAGSTVTDFTDLGDVPSSYTGQANKVVSVKNDETGLEFTTPSGGGDAYLANDQTFTGENTFAIGSGNDTPVTITKAGSNAALKVTKSSGSGDAIEVAQGSLSIADETASRIAIFDANKRVKSGNTSTYPSLTEIEHVKGVTSAIQTQLNSKTDTITSFVLIGTWASPADGATTYVPIWGNIGTPLGTITTLLTSLNYASRVVGIFVQHFNNSGTQGSNENFAIRLRNNTTSTSTQLINIQTNQASTVIKNFSAFGLTVDSAANDELAIEFLAPTWSTNPTQLQLRIVLFIQKL